VKTTSLLFLSIFFATLAVANPHETNKKELASVIKTGKKASSILLKTLGTYLKKHLKTEGTIGAAKFCITNAYALTEKVSANLGKNVSIKRVSLRYRNPANKPEFDEIKILRSLQTLQDHNIILPEYLVEHPDRDTYKYYKPIHINKDACLKCHGYLDEDFKLISVLKDAYPDDRATEYEMGDLRGMIIVTIKK